MTPEEKHLYYDLLKKLPFTVKRQKNLGNYIVDFYIPSQRFVIEVDGSQHFKEDHRIADEKRDKDLYMLNLTVVRYTNKDIHNNFEGVCKDILKRLNLKWEDLKR